MQIKTKLLLYFFAFLISLGCFQSAHASTFVWHGGTSGDWGTGANWLVGGVEQAAAPTGRDDVTFDNSAHTYTITGAADAVCISINTLGTTNAVSINIGVYNLTAYGSATLKSGDSITCEMFRVAYTASGTFTQSGATVSAHLYLSPGTSHTITLGSDVSLSGTKYFYFVSGILDTSANSYDITCYRFDDSGTTAARTLTLNSSIITCQLFVISGTAANLTVTSTDHTITINSDSATANNFAGKAWGIVNFKSNASEARAHAITFGTGASFVQFNIDQLTDRRDCSLSFSGDFYVSDSSTWKSAGAGNDDPTVRLLIRSDVIGTERNVDFTQADQTLTITDVDLQDIKIHDTNYPTVALTRVGDCGGNAKTNDGRHRQNVSDAKTVYMYGAAVSNSNYYDNIWSSVNTDQAARIAALALTNFPLPQDTAVIDDLTWTATGKYLTTNYPRLGTIDASALTTASCQINVGSSTDSTYYGSLNIPSGKANGQGSTLTFDARLANLSIDVGGSIGSSSPVTINSYGNVVSLGSAITHTGTFTLTRGTFDLNGKTFTTNSFSSSNTNTRTLDNTGGAGKIVVNGTSGTVFDMTDPTNLTVNNAPKIDIGDSDNTLTGDITFAGGGKTFGDFTNKKHAGNFDTLITGSNIFGSFTLETPDVTYQYSDIQFTAGTTTTVSSFVADGTASYPINITSVGGAATHTLLDASGNNTVTYCNISYSSVDGGGGWYAMTTSGNTNGGNNAGWIFTITEFVSIVDPGASAESDYSSLSTWNTGVATDLTAASTMVFAGTKTGTINDNASVTGATSGATATVVHANKDGTQLLLENISGGPFQNGEQIRVDVSNFFTTSNTGDSAIAVAKCRTSTGQADTTAVTITGWTTSAENYIKIWTDPSENYRHKGVWDENKYSLKTNNIQTTLKLSEEYVRVDGLQIKYTGTYSGYMNAIESAVDTTSSDQQISNNIINVAANNTGGSIAGIDMSSSSNNCARKIWNNIIYLTGSTSATPYGMWINAYAVDYTYNNTIIGFTYGFYIYGESNTNILLKNNIAQNCTTWGYSGYFNSSSTNNITNISAIDGVFGASADSGTTDSTTANKLVDSDQDFSMTVKVGMIIKNTTDSTYTYVTAVDSNSTLSVANDIMPTGKAYTIYTNMYGSPTFEDSANYDFHLDSSDTVAKNKGANLYADTYIPVTTDIDGNARPNSSTTFDIGADENVARIYRSVGPSATTALTTGISNYHSNHLTISGVTATFEYPLDDNIGVGDAIQYDADGDGDIDASDGIAFIDKRFSSVSYRIKKSDGTAPTAMAVPDIDWSLFRAYTSLSLAEAGTENVGIDADLVNFDTGDVDLTTNNLQWNFACYANGTTADTTAVTINDWTTTIDNYIKIYTPTAINEVGTSQRHQGIYNTSYYNLDSSSGIPLTISDEYVRIEGLQFYSNLLYVSTNCDIYVGLIAGTSGIYISQSLLKGNSISGKYGIYLTSTGSSSAAKIWNNTIYDYSSGIGIYWWNDVDWTVYAYNNTIQNCAIGLKRGNDTAQYIKNNLISATDAFNGTFTDSDINNDYNSISENNAGEVAIGSHGRYNQTFSFVDSTNKDFHLLPSDAGAKNYGADLSNDPYLPFNTDADDANLLGSSTSKSGSDVSNNSNFSRPRGTTWDIGADEVITPIYRSVAPEADGDLGAIDDDNSLADTLSITTAGVATFEVAVADNVGVGDAIVFDDDADNDLDANDTILFIHGRTDSTHYTVRTDTGGFPTASTTDNDKWAIYRAYTSLSLAEAGTKNTAIPISFTGGNRDIAANSEQWNIACYANGTTADTTEASITGWTTAPTNYIRVYTPYLTSEVVTSQRHSGKWDENKYHLAVEDNTVLSVSEENVWIDGLQVNLTHASEIAQSAVVFCGATGTADYGLSNSIIKGPGIGYTDNDGIVVADAGSGKSEIWNNIVYDFGDSGNSSSQIGIAIYDADFTNYIYNNTVYNSDNGYYQAAGTIIAKNNIAYNNHDNWNGTFSGNNNLSGPGTDADIPATNKRDGVTVTFEDSANNDFHLDSSDTGAKNYGIILNDSGDDANLYFTTDVDNEARKDVVGSWDIGADENVAKIYRSVGPSATTAITTGTSDYHSNHLTISGITATFEYPLDDNIGVGDAIQYDADGDGDIDVSDGIAFIDKRFSSVSYRIKKSDGTAPTAMAVPDIDWSLFRAYTSLSLAEAGTENVGIDADLVNFDTGDVDLTTNNLQWNFACYANGTTADTTAVTINDWTTTIDNYIKIYTPTAINEVGTSQRHQGIYNTSYYNLDSSSGIPLTISDEYVRIEGLQFYSNLLYVSTNCDIYVGLIAGTSGIYISQSLLKGNSISGKYGIYLTSTGSSSAAKIWNNTIYDYSSGIGIYWWNDVDWTVYAYNNTIQNCAIGLKRGNDTAQYIKNNLISATDAFNGTFTDSDINNDYNSISENNAGEVAIGSHGRYNQTFSFVDSTNKDFHLLPSDAGAKNYGADLSNDPYLPFNTDADDANLLGSSTSKSGSDVSNNSNFSRPRGTTWDIGADEVITPIYRSVAPEADGDLGAIDDDNSLADTLSITTAGVATFEVAVADNVGVGDAIVFDDDADNDLDANDTILFIHGRTDSTHYTVRTDTGGFPTASTTDNDKWAIYRAYTSLSLAEAGTKNTAIPISFTGGNRDIAANSEQWNIACYANGTTADTTEASITGWTTAPTNYIRVYTPYLTSEVVTSQRHSGKWDENKYHLAVEDNTVLSVSEENVWIDGLQVNLTHASEIAQSAVVFCGATGTADYGLSNSIIKGPGIGYTDNDGIVVADAGSGKSEIWNNIVYDFGDSGNSSSQIGIAIYDADFTNYIYNNTVYNSDNGYYQAAGTIIAKNNIAYNNHDNWNGTFSGNNNLSGPGTDADIPATNKRDGVTVNFADTANDDFHLASTDAGAKDYGADLSNDPIWQGLWQGLSPQNGDLVPTIGKDIDGAGRPMNLGASTTASGWDIGADEVSTAIYRSIAPSATTALDTGTADGNNLTISGSTMTVATATPDTIGVGDVIQYDSDNNGSVDALAFITARASSSQYTVKSAIGGTPIPTTAADQDWSIFRSYASLSTAEQGNENSGIADTLENFDDWTVGGGRDDDEVGKNLMTYNEQWNIAAYANGTTADSGVTINGWITAPANYVKVYTPTATTEVGTSQRHQGKWDVNKYYVTGAIDFYTKYFRMDGIQTKISASSGYPINIRSFVNDVNSETQISNNIVSLNSTGTSGASGITQAYGYYSILKIWNNIFYDFNSSIYDAAVDFSGGLIYLDNNSSVNSRRGFQQEGSATIIAKNNIAYNNNDNWVGSFSASGTNNLSGPGSDAQIPPTGAQNGVTVIFEDAANNDFHLSAADTGARNNGADLSADSSLAIQNDVDGHTRSTSSHTGAFDIGADEGATAMYFSVGQNTTTHETGAGDVDVDATTKTATFTVAQTATNMGVGDVIDYDSDNKKCYITGKTSTTVWTCLSATGTAPTDSGGNVTVNSISHAFANLNAAANATLGTNAGDASHLNTKDLYANNYQLNVPCYYDSGPDTTTVTVDGWTTGQPNYIRIYTPNNISTEANRSQRHQGKWDDTKYNMSFTYNQVILPEINNLRIEGLQLSGGSKGAYGILAYDYSMYVSNTIIKNAATGISAGNSKINNVIVYDSNVGIHSHNSSRNIFSNITLADNTTGFTSNCDNLVLAKNILLSGNATDYGGSGGCNNPITFTYTSTNLAEGASGIPAGTGNRYNQTFAFNDSTNKDYHLALTDTAARNYGVNLSADTNFAFSTDIDGNGRGTWDIGADEGSNEMVASVMVAGGDYSSLSGWQTGMVTNLPAPTTFVFSGTKTLTVGDNASVTGAVSGATATVVHATATQILLENISGTFQSGEQIQVDGSNYFTTTDAGNPAIATAKIDGAWASADTNAVTITGWETGPTNYIRIYTATDARHSGKWDDGKYRISLTGWGSYAVDISARYVRIDGVQVSNTSGGQVAFINASTNSTDNDSDVRISNNIMKGPRVTYAIQIGYVNSKTWNNIIYDVNEAGILVNNWATNQNHYIYNNTFYNTPIGIRNHGASNVIAKNNITQNCTDGFVSTGGGSFAAASDYNLTDNTSGAPGTHSKQNTKVRFMDENGDDFRLASDDTGAKDSGTDLSADVYLAFSTDIKSKTRSGTWDIGADETSTAIYRSIAPDDNGDNNLAALAVGTANSMTISGSTATFTSDLPTNIGVGDVLQYDSDNNGSIGAGDVPVFISARISATQFSVKSASGGTPTARAGDTYWSIFRAYTSLSYAEAGTENTAIDSNLRDFDTWSGGKDIVTSGEQWNISCYANGTTADTTAVTINGWTTSASDYIKIYTPVSSSEVGVTQRHLGKWDDSKYKIESSGAIIQIIEDYVAIDGLQMKTTSSDTYNYGIALSDTITTGSIIKISNNIMRAVLSGSSNNNFGISGGSASGTWTVNVWNNIIYDFINGLQNSNAGIYFGSGWNVNAYNNTVTNCYGGFSRNGGTFITKNNISYNNTTDYSGSFDTSSTNNLSKDATAPPYNTFYTGITDLAFADVANSDFHLANSDARARDHGADLSSDSNLSFSTDIDGELRNVGGAWDIGADESGTTVKINGGVKIEGGVKIQKN
jgi:hypothetical protein